MADFESAWNNLNGAKNLRFSAMRKLWVLLALLCLAGCGTQYSKVGFSQQQFDADLYQCQKENPDLVWGIGSDEGLTQQCMRAKGYTTSGL